MQTNREIKESVKDKIRNGERKYIYGMSAVLFIVPMITIFMPKIYLFFQIIVLIFLYPYFKMLYKNAEGKELEMEDCYDFRGIKKYIFSTIVVALNMCSYLFPYILCLLVELVGMYLKIDIVIQIGKILCYLYTIIFLFKSLKFILYAFYVCRFEDDDLSARLIIHRNNMLMEDEFKDLLLFICSYIPLFLLCVLTLNIASFFVMPLFYSGLILWFYNHEFGEPMTEYYNKYNEDITSGLDYNKQQYWQEQQNEYKEERERNLNNYYANLQMQQSYNQQMNQPYGQQMQQPYNNYNGYNTNYNNYNNPNNPNGYNGYNGYNNSNNYNGY